MESSGSDLLRIDGTGSSGSDRASSKASERESAESVGDGERLKIDVKKNYNVCMNSSLNNVFTIHKSI